MTAAPVYINGGADQLARYRDRGPVWETRYQLTAAGFIGLFYIDDAGQIAGAHGVSLNGTRIVADQQWYDGRPGSVPKPTQFGPSPATRNSILAALSPAATPARAASAKRAGMGLALAAGGAFVLLFMGGRR